MRSTEDWPNYEFMISSTMGKSPRTGRRLLPPMYSRKTTDQTQETTCTVQSCCYLRGLVMPMIGQIQQQKGRNTQFKKNRNNVFTQTCILIWNIFLYQPIHNFTLYIRPTRPGRVDPAELTQADLTRGRLDPDSYQETLYRVSLVEEGSSLRVDSCQVDLQKLEEHQ